MASGCVCWPSLSFVRKWGFDEAWSLQGNVCGLVKYAHPGAQDISQPREQPSLILRFQPLLIFFVSSELSSTYLSILLRLDTHDIITYLVENMWPRNPLHLPRVYTQYFPAGNSGVIVNNNTCYQMIH